MLQIKLVREVTRFYKQGEDWYANKEKALCGAFSLFL